MQPIAGGEAKPLTVGKPGDGGPQFAPDGTPFSSFPAATVGSKCGSPTLTRPPARPAMRKS